MAVNNKKNIFSNDKGQAIFEFVIFLPFLIFLYSVIVNITNSINGSINQQKATRGYFYRILKHDSKIPGRTDMNFLMSQNINVMGQFSIGWTAKKEGSSQAFGTCYKFASLFGGDTDQECNDRMDSGETTSSFIKLFTFYGVCGATYLRNPASGFYEEGNFLRMGQFAADLQPDHCNQK